jgi:hypothetical protein
LWSFLLIFKNAFRIKPVEVEKNAKFAQRYRLFNHFDWNESRSSKYPIFLSNSGILDIHGLEGAYEKINVKRGAVRIETDAEYKGEVYLAKSGQKLTARLFTPNKIAVDFTVHEQELLVLNQNYYTGWKVQKGNKVFPAVSYNGLIALPVSEGHHHVIFFYMPLSFIMGIIVSTISILGAVFPYTRVFIRTIKKDNTFLNR